MTNPNDPAFIDAIGQGFKNGLTKREYFSAMAMQGLLANSVVANGITLDSKRKTISEAALLVADALISELNKPESQ